MDAGLPPSSACDVVEAIDMAKSILLDCASEVPPVVTVETTAITPENAKAMMGN
jgi:ribose transport system substrate-binding protein